MPHRIGILLYPGYQLLDAAGPMAVFEAAYLESGRPCYEQVVLSLSGGPISSSGGAALHTMSLASAPSVDTLILCGGIGAVTPHIDRGIVDFTVAHHAAGRRTASVCTGAFILAHAGLLDGRDATTHWRFAAELARRYPRVRVSAERIWIRDKLLWTSAGVTAGIDLALALVSEDLGEATAKRIAQELVVYHRRPGGQSQFSALLEIDEPTGRFGSLLGWIRENLHLPLSVEQLADRAAMSPRNFARAFHKETGVTPGKAVEQMRLEAAREWVERGTHSLTHIARAVGFGSVDRMRNAFLRAYGMPPQTIRRIF